MQNGYPPINMKFADRNRYYGAFDSYYRNNDMSAMVDIVAGYVKERLSKYIAFSTSGIE